MDHHWSDDHGAVHADAEALAVAGSASLWRTRPATTVHLPQPSTAGTSDAERS